MVWPIKPVNVIIVEWLFVALATVFVTLRIYMRNYRNKHDFFHFTAGDWIIILTLVCFFATAACDTVMVTSGFSDERLSLDQTLEDPWSAYLKLDKARLRHLLKMLYASSMPYYLSLWGVKFYLVTLFYQLIPPATMPKQRIALHIITIFVISSCFVWLGLNIFWCIPISSNWEVEQPQDACVAYFAYDPYIVTVSLHTGTEIMIFSLPFSFLHVLRRNNKKQFYAASAVFAIGFVGVIITLGRVAYVFTAGSGPIIGMQQAWAAVEQSVGIIVCCLPAFKSLVLRKKSLGSGSRLVGSGSRSAHDSRRRSAPVAMGETGARPLEGRGGVIDPDASIMRVETFEQESRGRRGSLTSMLLPGGLSRKNSLNKVPSTATTGELAPAAERPRPQRKITGLETISDA
ncbi:hypothetical protein TWF106_011019 [Orbilia oligospora]|uniref:Rhodopsin domain-containing protein n=1 Tax=Orbilia oligospora TaxID=2813651 RepID=A0A7C8UH75_ORBOL|nr:hypothetical protein TWF106_011019 [Orbilia oligospora]